MVGLNQPTPPLERRRVVVRGQQLKRLENCAQREDCLRIHEESLHHPCGNDLRRDSGWLLDAEASK